VGDQFADDRADRVGRLPAVDLAQPDRPCQRPGEGLVHRVLRPAKSPVGAYSWDTSRPADAG
jgi:hypothetical protein